ncbi:hypothetical protein MMC34_008726, partial [Xylographa carneopallida]|nr:hypothetical protein [Xylographa carneopallida]
LKVQHECCHAWKEAHAEEISAAYLLARGMAARGADCQPFTKLRNVQVQMCWCTRPAVWHALLSLMQHAMHLRCVEELTSCHPLEVTALAYLLELRALYPMCMWPPSLANFLVDTPSFRLRARIGE